ncbi:hypothetical protein [Streptosporangium sp. KLBMP 9127]|nr:hypothetical protein [Streptosporangium sp. KLBMP 9127]
MNIKRTVAAALTMALTGGGLLLGPAAQAATGTDQRAPGHATAQRVDFALPGVIIWRQPTSQSSRNGLGYPGQGFQIDRVEIHGNYACQTGLSSNQWSHGRNLATGVVGWVPACNLADPN